MRGREAEFKQCFLSISVLDKLMPSHSWAHLKALLLLMHFTDKKLNLFSRLKSLFANPPGSLRFLPMYYVCSQYTGKRLMDRYAESTNRTCNSKVCHTVSHFKSVSH